MNIIVIMCNISHQSKGEVIMKFGKHCLSLCLLAFCVLFIGYSGDADAQHSFHPGVLLEAGGKPIDIEVGHVVPVAFDWNSDGKKDLITGQFQDGIISLFLNEGTDAKPVLKKAEKMKAGGDEIKLPAG